MKFFCSLLAILMLALSCVPCSDTECIATEQVQTGSTTGRHTEHSGASQKEHKDLCSPFCQCSCCAVAYALPEQAFPELLHKPEVPAKAFAVYLQKHPVGIVSPVWQPPQTA